MIYSLETDFRRVPSLDHLMRIRKRRSPADRPSVPPSDSPSTLRQHKWFRRLFFYCQEQETATTTTTSTDGGGDNRFPISPRVHTATKTVCCRISYNPFKLWTRTSRFILPSKIGMTLLIKQKGLQLFVR